MLNYPHHMQMTLQQFSIELDNYENDLVIYLDFYDQTYNCSAGNDLRFNFACLSFLDFSSIEGTYT